MPLKEELKVREYDIYKGYYCGLCKTLGREFNQFVRLGLNYDLAFLGILLSSIDDKKDSCKMEKCIVSPVKKKLVINSNEHIKYSGSMGIILIYFKLLDDWKDDFSIKSKLASVPYIKPLKKVKSYYNEKYIVIRDRIEELSKLENIKNNIIDQNADVFGKLMEEIAKPDIITDTKIKRILGSLGYNLGRWIYILDAYDDLKDDIKNNSYNPIIEQYKYKKDENIEDFINRIKENIHLTLTYTLDNIAKSYELLDIYNNKEILDNIIYLGLRKKMNLIFKRKDVEIGKSI